ncbi:electron transfer flavoprotein beta subunit/FixA family protein [Sandaracinomonas limnophila]|uniref:Electron transfer flavoprotein beta subunit/FixA family protein n=1 Tax=Sandaracinomonas limnophila TaxID=1862386 RepID=A0A437PWW1_9BACT|nr:electron transfer flavoprotein subunit beta/FixA family protein [Sandaracinomonas limnophila]RVU26698.1 electron transfer flavoprotein beta subunit/FixA family protein [Sandaracinomonas limnophila]
MNILVCIGIVPDTTSKLQIDSSTNKIDYNGLTMIIGPYEEYALSRAVEIKEQVGANVSVIYVGEDASSEQVLRKCLAIGADEAFWIKTAAVSSRQVANEIYNFLQTKKYDLILTGKESIDTNSGLMPNLLALKLNIPYFTPVMKLELIGNSSVQIKVEVEEGTAEIEVNLPLILGCQEPIAEWKIPSMRGIMSARTKPLTILDPLGVKSSNSISDQVISKQRLQKKIEMDSINDLVNVINQINK